MANRTITDNGGPTRNKPENADNELAKALALWGGKSREQEITEFTERLRKVPWAR